MALHRLVDIHRVQARRIETGEPHVAHDHELERVIRLLDTLGEQFPPRLRPRADMCLPSRRIGRRTRHYDLDRAGLVIVAVPLRAELNNGVIEGDANAAAHADDHSLAVECRQPILEMLHEVLGNKGETLLGAN